MSQIRSTINLESLVELSNKLNRNHEISFILNSALLSIMGKLTFLRGAILAQNPITLEFEVLSSKGKFNPFFLNEEILLSKDFEQFDQNIFWNESKSCLIVLIASQNNRKSALVLQSRVFENPISIEELYYVRLVSILTTNALLIAENYKSILQTKNNLERQNQLLSTLYEIAKDFGALLSKEEIISHFRFWIMGQLLVNRFAIFLRSKNGFSEVVNRFDCNFDDNILSFLFSLNKQISFKEFNLLPSTIANFLYKNVIKVISPMIYQNNTSGILILGRRLDGVEYSDENLRFIEAFGNTAILFLENFRLIQEEIKKKQIEKELMLALDIQGNLLPQNFPEIDGIDYFGKSVPSRFVGGDYFDIMKTEDEEILFVIADVSGKGIPSALIMANIQAGLKILSKMNLSLNYIIQNLNLLVFENTSPEKFVTMFLGKLNLRTKNFTYINAGHCPPILLRANGRESSLLKEGGMILGFIQEGVEYVSGEIILSAGDLILFYTDGITEATNPNGLEFGESRLINLLFEFQNLPSQSIVDKIIENIGRFTNSNELSDDLTLMVLKIIK